MQQLVLIRIGVLGVSSDDDEGTATDPQGASEFGRHVDEEGGGGGGDGDEELAFSAAFNDFGVGVGFGDEGGG